MTGIVLCEISSGLAIEPRQLPDGALGDDNSVTLQATGAVGDVSWGFAPPGYVAYEAGLPPGRTLTDNGDGTATISGTFSTPGTGPYLIYAWDSVGQVAKISGDMTVNFEFEPFIQKAIGGGPVFVLRLLARPSGYISASAQFDPPLPAGWTVTTNLQGKMVIVDTDTGTWNGTITFTYSYGWPGKLGSTSLTTSIPFGP